MQELLPLEDSEHSSFLVFTFLNKQKTKKSVFIKNKGIGQKIKTEKNKLKTIQNI